MPFIDGQSLRARLAAGPIPIDECVSLLRDVARALAYAHEHQVVHRDIKPDNVLISGASATVTDFGIAKAISAARATDTLDGIGGGALTQLGMSIGTPAYMAPEQAAADPSTDHRADIYSFGCMAYEMLAGRPPFADLSPQKLLAAHMGQRPQPVSELRPDAPPALAEIVMQCLEKDPDARPQRAADIARVLDAVSSGASGPVAAADRPGSFRRGAVMYVIAFAAAVILAKAAEVAFAVPDWVMSTTIAIMLIGIPLVSRHRLRATRIPAGRGVDSANRGGTRRRADDADDDRGSGQPVPLLAAHDRIHGEHPRQLRAARRRADGAAAARTRPAQIVDGERATARSRQDSHRRFHVDWIRHHARKRHRRGGSGGPWPVAGHFHHHAAERWPPICNSCSARRIHGSTRRWRASWRGARARRRS